jgi:hypothetical protein
MSVFLHKWLAAVCLIILGTLCVKIELDTPTKARMVPRENQTLGWLLDC